MLEFYLCLFGGIFGLHKFYTKDYKMGLLYLITFGLFGIGWMRDTIQILKRIRSSEEYQNKKLARVEAKARAREQREIALAEEKEKTQQMDEAGVAYCPRCKSTTVQYVERRQRLSIGRAVVGTVLLNPLWGAVGAVTSNKRKGFVKCLKCGYSWRL